MSNVSIWDILGPYQTQHPTIPWGQIHEQLVGREQAMSDMFRLAGAQFGLYPQIVAEVLAEAQMGEPIEAAQREMIRAQFVALMEELQRQHGQG